jgi:hypothetical protein
MTEQTSNPAGQAGVSTPDQIIRSLSINGVPDRLMVAAQAARLAIDVASEAERTTRAARLAPEGISRNWRAANLLAQIAFDRFYGDVIELDLIIKSMRQQG